MSLGEQHQASPAPAVVETESQAETKNLLTDILDGMARDVEQRRVAEDAVKAFVDQVMGGAMKMSAGAYAMIKDRISQIDALVTRQVNNVLHTPEFQGLEATWRGLHYLVQQTETGDMLKIRVLNVSKDELAQDMKRAPEFTQSALWKKVYDHEYGQAGGTPYGVLVGDYEFSRNNEDVALLGKISGVAAAAHAPFIAAASSEMFNMDDFSALDEPRDLRRTFDSADYIKWKSFRATTDSRYVGLCLPRILLREPYDPGAGRAESFRFKEDVDGRDHAKYLWGNAAFALAARLTDSFAQHGWCSAICGLENGGAVANLPLHTFDTKEGDRVVKCPTEVLITDTREKELADLGFIPLVNYKNTDYAVFPAVSSCHKPPKYATQEAEENARLGVQLNYLMSVSRIAHYLKVMMRDKIGSPMSREECHHFLNNWITNYVTEDDMASAEAKAKRPLREARIDVEEIPGEPGAYRAVAYLRPHFLLTKVNVTLSLVADLPKGREG